MNLDLLRSAAVDDVALTRFARQVPDPALFILNRYFPEVSVNSIKARILTDSRTIDVARFRTYDAETPVGRRGITRDLTEVTLPPVGRKTTVGELETILRYMTDNSTSANQDLVDAMYDDVQNNVLSIRYRQEMARGGLISSGVFSLIDNSENGLVGLQADYQIGASHLPVVPIFWSNAATALPLTDELGMVQQIANDGGSPPDVLLAPLAVVRLMAQTAEYKSSAYPDRAAGGGPTLTPALLQTVRDQWGLPTIVVYDAQVSVDGVQRRVTPANRVQLFNSAGLGQTQYGLTAEALALSAGSNPGIDRRDAPGIVATRRFTDDPVAVWNRATANAMPVLFQGRNLISAQVLA